MDRLLAWFKCLILPVSFKRLLFLVSVLRPFCQMTDSLTMREHLACSCYSHLCRGYSTNGFFYVSSSIECLGIHLGGPQSANLGDGNGWVNQTVRLFLRFQVPSVSNPVCV